MRLHPALVLLLLVAGVAFVYAPVVGHEFVDFDEAWYETIIGWQSTGNQKGLISSSTDWHEPYNLATLCRIGRRESLAGHV